MRAPQLGSRHFSLPPCIKESLEGGKVQSMQMFERATLVVARISNLPELSRKVSHTQLASALAG